MYHVRRFTDFVHRNILVIERNIHLDITGKDEYILLHLTDRTAQNLRRNFTDVDTVDQYFAALYIIITSDQSDNVPLRTIRLSVPITRIIAKTDTR